MKAKDNQCGVARGFPLGWLTGLLLIVVSTSGTVLALELGLRIVSGHLPDGSLAALQGPMAERLPDRLVFSPGIRMLRFSQLQTHRVLGYRYPPRSRLTILHPDYGKVDIELDEYGFRNRIPSVYRTADIVILGDSYTLALTASYEDSWPRLLESRVGAAVLNLAVSSYDFYQYERLLPLFAGEASPQWVILGVFQNDFWCIHEAMDAFFAEHPGAPYADYRAATQSLAQEGRLRRAREIKRNIKAFVEQNSYLVALIKHAVAVRSVHQTLAFAKNPAVAMRVDPSLLANYPNETQLTESCAGRLARRALAAIVRWAEERQARLLVLYFPQKEEVYLPWLLEEPSFFTTNLDLGDATVSIKNAPVYARYLRTLSQELRFEFIDLTGPFRAHRDALVYFPLDGHTNTTGQRIAASAISQVLGRMNMVVGASPGATAH